MWDYYLLMGKDSHYNVKNISLIRTFSLILQLNVFRSNRTISVIDYTFRTALTMNALTQTIIMLCHFYRTK